MGVDKLDAMIESLYGKQVHILVDSDNEGEKIRKWFKRYLSEVIILELINNIVKLQNVQSHISHES